MFSVNFRQLYRSYDKIIIRSLRNRKYEVSKQNPGLDRRIKVFQNDGLQITNEDAEEFIEQSESDFYQVGEAYNEHLNETLMGKYDLRHQIIKEKYFKENMPNLLTWSEKEQIRHLANSEPDEWTPEKIAQSFPITVPVVKKLLKYPWKPATEERIARHDASVMRNWRELKDGSLNIMKDLREHFLKFSDRTIPPLNKKSIKIDITQNEKMGEFERIIHKCAEREYQKSSATDENSNTSEDNEKVRKDFKRVTLDQLTIKIQKRLEGGSNVTLPDKIILDTVNSIEDSKNISNNTKEIDLSHVNEAETGLTKFDDRDKDAINVMSYPERIRIPKKAYKKDATYKVNDCYYDHDGKFLYRVLGMSN